MFNRVRRLSLTWWIFIGMAAGILLGEFAPGFAAQLKPLSHASDYLTEAGRPILDEEHFRKM